jgi:hypothetical protein
LSRARKKKLKIDDVIEQEKKKKGFDVVPLGLGKDRTL